MSRRTFATFLGALAVLPVLVVCVSPTAAFAAGDGLTFANTTTYTIDPAAGVVRVVSEMTLTNTIADTRDGNVITSHYFSGFSLPAPADAQNARATTANGRALRLTKRPASNSNSFVLYEITFANDLLYQQTARVNVSYDITGLPPRSDNPSRVNSAYAAFDAFGVGDEGKVTVRVVVPAGFTSDTFGNDASITTEDGNTVYTATNIPNPNEFDIFISARNDANLAQTDVTSKNNNQFNLRSWPGDAGWQTFVTTQLNDGEPELSKLIGQAWPIKDKVEVREAYTPYLYGYAGWFSASKNLIEIGEDLDQEVVLHELSHAWFNDEWFSDRWINEGLAQVYSNMAVSVLGGAPKSPDTVDANDAGFVLLNDWSNPSFTSGADTSEKYGYNAAFSVTKTIVDEVGEERMRDVFAATADKSIPYAGRSATEKLNSVGDWRRFLDLLEEVGGSKAAEDLFSKYVATSTQISTLKERTAARDAYHQLIQDGGDWRAPYAVRREMSTWDFASATSLIKDSEGVLALRNELDAKAKKIDSAYPATYQGDYEAADKDLKAVTKEVQGEIAAADAVLAATTENSKSRGLFDKVGLIGTSLPNLLSEAKSAFSQGDQKAAELNANKVIDTLRDATDLGKQRALFALGGLLLVIALVILLIVLLRRRRCRRQTPPTPDAAETAGEDLSGAETYADNASPQGTTSPSVTHASSGGFSLLPPGPST